MSDDDAEERLQHSVNIHDSVAVYIRDLKDGDDDAAAALWERYFDKLVGLSRRRMYGANKRMGDEEDVAISVFESLCRGAKGGKFTELTDGQDLWKLLCTLARRKAARHRSHGNAAKRGGGDVRGHSVFERAGADSGGTFDQVGGVEPTPEFLAILRDQHEYLMAALPNDSLREVAQLILEGHTNEEIAGKIGRTVRTAERKRDLVRREWEKLIQND